MASAVPGSRSPSGPPWPPRCAVVRQFRFRCSGTALFCPDTATTEFYTLSLHDALPISTDQARPERQEVPLRRGRFQYFGGDRKSTRLNSSHSQISYAVFCLKKKTGSCHGRGGSMHIADPDIGVLGANGIGGAGLPIAVGPALAAQVRCRQAVSISLFGHGSLLS